MRTEGATIQTPEQFAKTLSGGSNIAKRLLDNNMDPYALRMNSLLREGPGGEWEQIDQAAIETAKATLVGVADLLGNPALTVDYRQFGLGVSFSSFRKVGDVEGATLSMDPRTRTLKDRPDFTKVLVPLPFCFKDFDFDIRDINASRRFGEPLDTTMVRFATRMVSEALEELLFNGTTLIVDGNPIYGYTTHPSINSVTGAGDWGTVTNIYPTVVDMVAACKADNHNGPYNLYISPLQYTQMFTVYTDGSGQSALTRIKANLQEVRSIKQANNLADGRALLVEMSPETVDWVICSDILPISWNEQGGLVLEYKVLGCQAPRVKADANGKCGIALVTNA